MPPQRRIEQTQSYLDCVCSIYRAHTLSVQDTKASAWKIEQTQSKYDYGCSILHHGTARYLFSRYPDGYYELSVITPCAQPLKVVIWNLLQCHIQTYHKAYKHPLPRIPLYRKKQIHGGYLSGLYVQLVLQGQIKRIIIKGVLCFGQSLFVRMVP